MPILRILKKLKKFIQIKMMMYVLTGVMLVSIPLLILFILIMILLKNGVKMNMKKNQNKKYQMMIFFTIIIRSV